MYLPVPYKQLERIMLPHQRTRSERVFLPVDDAAIIVGKRLWLIQPGYSVGHRRCRLDDRILYGTH